ncbi:MAG: VWA domain-containing protein [Cloacibacterium sp.]|nr:VWA domain-containing protein [Cloacibacterium sp.]
MFDFEFYSPYFLLLFIAFIPLIFKDIKAKKNRGIKIPSTKNMAEVGYFHWIQRFLKITKYIILSALIVALARPRTYTVSQQQDETKGIDILLTTDISVSMLARDLNPDRLTALKKITEKFIKQRQNDRLGLVVFSGEGFMKVPLTTDHQVVIDEVNEMQPGDVSHGTAIGEGLAVAVKHLKESKAKSKIVILLTDGVDENRNAITPQTATELAKNNGIKVYTVGIGTNGFAEAPSFSFFGDIIFEMKEVIIDEAVLTQIASETGGKYFRATSNDSLEKIYEEINQFEKSDVRTNKLYDYQEYFRVFLLVALVTLIVDALLRWRLFRVMN